MSNNSEPLFFLIAGEASGDLLGARLMRGLKKLTKGKARFAGVGGERMLAEGLELTFPQSELSHMGIIEVARHLPNLLRRLRETADEVKRRKPVALITIDSPDFNFRVAKKLKKEKSGIPLIHYVAPSVWAWRPGRAKKIASFLDHLMALLPFEPPYFEKEGLPCTFVGHPIVESDVKGDGARFRARQNMPADVPLLTVLPGSRMGEVKRLLPVFHQALERLKTLHPSLHVVVPTVPQVADFVRAKTCRWTVPALVTLKDEDKYDAMAASVAALACSGTVSVELAMARLPGVIAYKANPLTAALVRRVVQVKYATLINIMQNRYVMPEFLQENCTGENLASAVHLLLTDTKARQSQIDEFTSIAAWLKQGKTLPSTRAAKVVMDVVQKAFSIQHSAFGERTQ
jgi:lipid-A-disaccharide synthase